MLVRKFLTNKRYYVLKMRTRLKLKDGAGIYGKCCRRPSLISAVGRSDIYKVREEIFYGQYAEKNYKDCP